MSSGAEREGQSVRGRGGYGSGGRRGSGHGGGRGRGRGRGGGQARSWAERECLEYKLLGKCERHDRGECTFSHRNIERTCCVEVKIQSKIPIAAALKGDFMRALKKIAECRLRVKSEDTIEIVVSQSNARHLAELKQTYENLLSQLYPIGPGWSYIHRDGVAMCEAGSLLGFRPYEGRCPVSPGAFSQAHSYELFINEGDDGGEARPLDVKHPPRESETREGVLRAIDRVHGDKEPFNPRDKRKDTGIKIIQDHHAHMEDMLRGGLEWFCQKKQEGKEPLVLKLEARFGKVLWRNLPEDITNDSFGIQQFAEFCFSDPKHARFFNTDVQQESADTVKQSLIEEHISDLETFDIKFTVPREKERYAVDVRIKFEHGRPNVLFAKRNEAKVVVFDVLSLHRNHDIRMTLNYYEALFPGSPEFRLIDKLLRTMSLSGDNSTLQLVARTDEWKVNCIRHKQRGAYRIEDKLLLTITSVRDHQLHDTPKYELISHALDTGKDPHTEIELHNCSWACAFGRDVDMSPEQSVVLLMDPPAVEPEVAAAIPHPWQPKHILEDFQEFWENLDTLNEMLTPSP